MIISWHKQTIICMQKFITLFAILLFCQNLKTQTTATFEDISLDPESFLNNAGMAGGFENGNLYLPNNYHPSWDGWDGWAISNTTDTQTPGFMNQYSAISGSGAENSTTYAVTFVLEKSIIELTNDALGGAVEGFYVNNGTYPYLSMLEGDGFAKKFGGESGDDPDYFLLTIKKYYEGVLSTDSIDFYLADYRFADNAQDYIVSDWTYIDLTSFGNIDSLQMTLSSTDNSNFGMNTPAYFCIDNFTTRDLPTSTKEQAYLFSFKLFPNPTSDWISVNYDSDSNAKIAIYNLNGILMKSKTIHQGHSSIEVSNFPDGLYFIELNLNGHREKATFVKH